LIGRSGSEAGANAWIPAGEVRPHQCAAHYIFNSFQRA